MKITFVRGCDVSVENNVFLKRSNMPDPKAWASAISAHGFPMVMDAEFDVEKFVGFLPCTYNGAEAGFEYDAEETDVAELVSEGLLTEEEAQQLDGRDFLVTLTTHADMREYVTSMIAAAVLCELSDGMLAEGGEPPFIEGAKSVSWAKKCEQELANEFD